MFNILTSILVCVGISPDQHSEITIRVKPDPSYSTIRYVYLVNYPGTTYMQTMGHFDRERNGDDISYVGNTAAELERATRLTATVHNDMHIMDARFTHYNSGMNNTPMDCVIEAEESDPHGGH